MSVKKSYSSGGMETDRTPMVNGNGRSSTRLTYRIHSSGSTPRGRSTGDRSQSRGRSSGRNRRNRNSSSHSSTDYSSDSGSVPLPRLPLSGRYRPHSPLATVTRGGWISSTGENLMIPSLSKPNKQRKTHPWLGGRCGKTSTTVKNHYNHYRRRAVKPAMKSRNAWSTYSRSPWTPRTYTISPNSPVLRDKTGRPVTPRTAVARLARGRPVTKPDPPTRRQRPGSPVINLYPQPPKNKRQTQRTYKPNSRTTTPVLKNQRSKTPQSPPRSRREESLSPVRTKTPVLRYKPPTHPWLESPCGQSMELQREEIRRRSRSRSRSHSPTPRCKTTVLSSLPNGTTLPSINSSV